MTVNYIRYRYGPMVHFWCMRFEGKHNYFKDLAHRIKCFKNIPKSMAYRHQELVCYYINSSKSRSPYCKESNIGQGMWTGLFVPLYIHCRINYNIISVSYAKLDTLEYKEALLSTLPQMQNNDIMR